MTDETNRKSLTSATPADFATTVGEILNSTQLRISSPGHLWVLSDKYKKEVIAKIEAAHTAALRGELEWIRDVCMVRDTQAAMDVYIISRRDFKARIARLNSQEQDNE